MTSAEIKSLIGDPTIPFPIDQVSFYKQTLFINNKVAIKVDNASSHFENTRDITIKNAASQEIGVLTFTRDNANILDPASNRILLSTLNPDQFVAYLAESDASLSYPNFKNNYVVLKREYLADYNRLFRDTAPLWGGFSHPNLTIDVNKSYKKVINEITAIPKLKIPKKHYYPNCLRAIQQPFAFERFLKFYHLLELSFDSLIVNKIQSLNLRNDSNRIGKILNEYDQKEIKRLFYLIKEKCKDPQRFVPILNTLNAFESTALNLLYVFGTEDNPIKKESSYLIISRSSFFGNDLELRNNSVSITTDRNLDTFLIQLASYIIYRVRNSIAHNKIGEFIFRSKDERFIVEFAEPLLREVLIQCFKR